MDVVGKDDFHCKDCGTFMDTISRPGSGCIRRGCPGCGAVWDIHFDSISGGFKHVERVLFAEYTPDAEDEEEN